MSRRLFPGQLADLIAGEDRTRAERLRQLARELVGVVRDGLIREGQVRIHGFGTFRLSRTRAHKGINPQTGERIDIPARNRVLFRPAKALRERIEPTWPAAVPLAEPQASREATLGGVMSEAPAAGAVPGGEGVRYRPSYFPDRIAAATMTDTVVRLSKPVAEYESPRSGSREANLGGTMGASPSAGRVPQGHTEHHPAGPAVDATEAAGPAADRDTQTAAGRPSREAVLGGSAVPDPRSAGALAPEDLPPGAQEPERPATVPVTRQGPERPPPPAGTAGVDLPPGASREAGLGGTVGSTRAAGGLPGEDDAGTEASSGFDVDAPLRVEQGRGSGSRPKADEDRGAGSPPRQPSAADRPAAAEATRPQVIIDGDLLPPEDSEPEPAAREERPWGVALLLVLLLVLLLAALAWWFWPRPQVPVATTTPEPAVAESEPVAPGAATGQPDEEAGQGAVEPAGTTRQADTGTTTGATAPATGERAVETAAGEPGEAPQATAASSDTAAGTGETQTAQTEATGAAAAAGAEVEPIEAGAEAGTVAEGAAEADTATGAAAEDTAVASADTEAATAAGTPPVTQEATTTASAEAAAGADEAMAGIEPPWFIGRSYSVERGDTLWDLSDHHYVNPYYWPHIWNHNRNVANPDLIEIDQRLWLPSLQGEPRALTPADRRSIAEGYLRLYRLWRETGAANPQYALVGVRYFDASVIPPELRDDPSAGRPRDALAAAFAALLEAEFPRQP